jgi:hypothetical protein
VASIPVQARQLIGMWQVPGRAEHPERRKTARFAREHDAFPDSGASEPELATQPGPRAIPCATTAAVALLTIW